MTSDKLFLAILLGSCYCSCGFVNGANVNNSSTSNNTSFGNRSLEFEEPETTCDPLHAEGTAVLCFPPIQHGFHPNVTGSNCTERSVAGTTASYTCRNFRGVVYSGFLKCATSGVWTVSFTFANNSLCNLDAAIVNFELPDVVILTSEPEFTTPLPTSEESPKSEFSEMNDHEKTALNLHNIFRRNHGAPSVKMSKQLNSITQRLANSIAFGVELRDVDSSLKMSPVRHTINIEMNWYFQVPRNPNTVEAVSNAIQSWYSGFGKYDWENAGKSLEDGDALAFARVIWKNTQLIGIGVASVDNFTFVACSYTPGRNIESIDPINELKSNVLPFKVGKQ